MFLFLCLKIICKYLSFYFLGLNFEELKGDLFFLEEFLL